MLAADDTPADTVLKQFPAVKVEADKYGFNREKRFAAYSEISRSDIELENPRQVSEILNKEPGIYIKDYGGLGGIKTISLRGTSSQQTLVLIEGMKFNSVQNSSTDFGVLPVSMLRNIDILRGGTSAIFGGSSIGGTLNFNLTEENNKLRVNAGAGSFGEYSASAATTFPAGSVPVSFAADYINAKSDFPFTVEQFGEEKTYRRNNADFENFNLMLNSIINSNNWNFKVIALGRLSERGSPGPVLMGYIEPDDARLSEKEADIIFKAANHTGKGDFTSGIMYRHNYQNFFDSNSPNALQGDTTSVFNTNDFQFNAKFNQDYAPVNLTYGIDGEFNDLSGDFLQPETGNYVKRVNAGFSLRAIVNIYEDENFILPVQIGGRYDLYSDVQGSPAGVAGLSFVFPQCNFALKTQAAYNYRAPSFNEMYYLNYGTADLKPERSTSLNISASYGIQSFHFELNGFLIDTRNQIIAVPKSPLTWSARNMASVLSRGVEFIVKTSFFDDILHLGGSYTLQSVIDNNENSDTYKEQVVYVPQEMLSAKISANYKGFFAGLNVDYSGFTYYLPENVYTSVIPAYYLLNFNMSKSFAFAGSEIILKFDVLNMLDKQYAVIKNYPMPGRIFRFGAEYRIL